MTLARRRKLRLVVGVSILGSCLESGEGERWDSCVHYIAAIAGARWFRGQARCPADCTAFEATDRTLESLHYAAARRAWE